LLRPRETVERILATNPRRHVVLLAGLAAIPAFLTEWIAAAPTTDILDWRIMLAGVALGATGVVALYVNAFFLRWSGKLIGGHASTLELRAALAWSSVPNVIALAICLVSLAALRLLAGASEPIAPALSVTLQAVTSVLGLWSLIAMMLMLARIQHFGFWRTVINFALGSLGAMLLLLTPLIVKSFFFQPFEILSGAMEPTLLVGDYLFASKYAYGYSHYSLPFSPRLFYGRVLASEPQRGDVVVFRLPKDDSADYIMRVIGLPGDRIQMIEGVLHINEVPVERERIYDLIDTEDGRRTTVVKRWRETLPNGVSYTTWDLYDSFLDNTPVYTVPPGNYFMMGDNRDNSQDSRVLSQVGYVPFENIVGRAAILFFSIDRKSAKPAVRFERLGASVQ
jgi:signal peptidase I